MFRCVLFAAVLVPVLSTAVFSQDQATPVPEPKGWTYTLAPYLWITGLRGETAAFGAPTISVDASFSDILENLDLAFMGAFEARRDRLVFAGDLMWTRLSADATTPLGIAANSAELTVTSLALTAAAGYNVVEDDRSSLDLLAGARLWSAENSLAFNGGLLGGRTIVDEQTWVDPLIGVKGKAYLSDRMFVTGWAMVGGFGVSSESMWDVNAGIGYEVSDRFSAILSYRVMGVDYENDGFIYDVVQSGPMLGGTFRF